MHLALGTYSVLKIYFVCVILDEPNIWDTSVIRNASLGTASAFIIL